MENKKNYFETSAAEALQEWNGDEIHAALLKMTHAAKKRDAAGTDASGQPRGMVMQWMSAAEDFESVVNAAWIRIAESDALQELPFAIAAARAIRNAARKIDRQERRHANALRTDDDAQREYVIDNAAPLAEPIAPGPEEAAIASDALNRACLDALDRRIIAARAAGYRQAVIAAGEGISQAAVNKRLQAIKKRWTAAQK